MATGNFKTLNENGDSFENRLELIQEVDPQDIVEQLDTRDVNRAIRNRRNGGEDETGSKGLWDLAFEETLNYLYREVGLDNLTDDEHHEYALLAEEVYNILVDNEENYANGRRPILNEQTEGKLIIEFRDADTSPYYPLGENYDGVIVIEGSNSRNARFDWQEELAKYVSENKLFTAAQLAELYEEDLEWGEYALYDLGDYLDADELEKIVLDSGLHIYHMSGYSKGDHYAIASTIELDPLYVEELEDIVFGGYYFYDVILHKVIDNIWEEQTRIGPMYLPYPYNEATKELFEDNMKQILHEAGEELIEGFLINLADAADHEIREYLLKRGFTEYFEDSRHLGENTEIKKYYILPLDNYGQPDGSVETIELTEEEFNKLKKTYIYVYDNYMQALRRAQD